MTIQIKKMQLEDIESVLKLCDEVREHHRDILDGYFTKQDNNMEKNMLLECLEKEDKFSLVAVENKNIIGMLLAEKRITPWLEEPKIANIFNFGICKHSRRKGVAKLLMNSFLIECEKANIKEIKLGVFNKNIGAYKFYENYGFEPQEQKMSLKIK